MIAIAISWPLLLGGSFLVVVAGLGLIRMPDLFTRMHASGLLDTMGMLLIVGGLMFQAGFTQVTLKLFLIAFFLLFTSPTATHALAKAARHGGVEPRLSDEEAV